MGTVVDNAKMNLQLEDIELANGRYCKAGFWHGLKDSCDHLVPLLGSSDHKPRPKPFLPADFYSEEATARRREENKAKYQPERASNLRGRELFGNEAEEMR